MKIKKYAGAAIIGLSLSSAMVSASVLKFSDEVVAEHGLKYRNDQFGNIHLNPETITTQTLASVMEHYVPTQKGKAVLAMVPLTVQNPAIYETLVTKFGFKPAFLTAGAIEYRFENGSTIPAAMTAVGGAHGILLRQTLQGLEALVVQEKTRPTRAGFVGGSQDPGEMIQETMIREIKEEIGVDAEIVYKIAGYSRKNGNRYGANDTCSYYILKSKTQDTELKLQEGEILSAHWAPVASILDGSWKVLSLAQDFKNLLDHFVNHRDETRSTTVLDLRQRGNPKPDMTDLMEFEYYAMGSNIKF